MTPTSTYRLQLTPEFGFRAAAAVVPYLAALGVGAVYLSPVLESAPGSTHGYDVVDHSRLSTERGGQEGWAVLQAALREHGLGCVVDVVPNHMARPTPASANPVLWSVLREGRASAYAHWFDVDWDAGAGRLALPVLGAALDDVLASGELVRDGDVLRYYDHAFPVAPETADLPWPEVVHAQHYDLCSWRDTATRLNHRRFFDVGELMGLRVEDPDVFDATHRVLLDLVAAGEIQGLRIDHPDGLADPAGYLARLRAAAPDAWLVVEKILEPGETLPAGWPCAGTTGYDALRVAGGAFVDPAGAGPLLAAHREFTGNTDPFPAVVEASKRDIWAGVLAPERARLGRVARRCLPDEDPDLLDAALTEYVVAMPVYRTYVVPGEEPATASVALVDATERTAAGRRPELAGTLARLRYLALGREPRTPDTDELAVRLQQCTGALTAKGVEDTAFYRWFPLAALNEVGGDPAGIGVPPAAFHDFAAATEAASPATMTTLSTHDGKRGEDVRARLAVLAAVPDEWATALREWRVAVPVPAAVDDRTDYLLRQTLVGAWPLDEQRLDGYLEKACREAKRETSWLDPDPAYEEAVRAHAHALLAEGPARVHLDAVLRRVTEPGLAIALAQKAVQLTMPGVPDVYQGAEVLHLALVDPDNRRPVDHAALAGLLDRLDGAGGAGAPPGWRDEPDAAKLWLVSRVLRLRRDRPDAFTGYAPLPVSGPGAGTVLAYARDGVAVVAPTVPADDRWAGTVVELPPGSWTGVLDASTRSGPVPLAELFATFPVSVLARA